MHDRRKLPYVFQVFVVVLVLDISSTNGVHSFLPCVLIVHLELDLDVHTYTITL